MQVMGFKTELSIRHCFAAVLAFVSPVGANAADTHLCSAVGASSNCQMPAVTFTSGAGASSKTLSGIPTADSMIIDAGQTASVPSQTYFDFGAIRNYGTFYNGNGTAFPWLRIMGPGAILENYGVAHNLTDTYVQDNAVLGTNAPTGSGSIYNHAGATFNNGSISLYGGIDLYDAASIRNDGTFNNYSSIGFVESTTSFVNNGQFTNYAKSSPPFGSPLYFDGTNTNAGTLRNVAGAAMDMGGTFLNTTTGRLINEGYFGTSTYSAGLGVLTNQGRVEMTATATGPAPNFYSPGTFVQTATGSLVVDGQFVQGKFDVQGGSVTGGGTLNTTHSNVPGTAPTFLVGAGATLSPGNGFDNSMLIVGDGQLRGDLLIELAGGGANGTGQGTQYDFLRVSADSSQYGSSTGYLDLGGSLSVSLLNGFSAKVGDYFDIILADGGLTGTFSSADVFSVSGYTFERQVIGNAVRLQVLNVAPVPLPAAVWLLMSGLMAMLGARRSIGRRS